ncbi:sensor histidine kinase [Thiohalophilus thiocyanatoxydans]|uniref:histidine kinase n=1 Tax=Thiohalophilus thiocyanatoxydans TaxID=381308 RepID=A0A4R8IX93_9GAMM|nr:sensor histidine kinase [Thiohalophilus thiocyanatoxydans]TDY02497.1 two-component system NtrC family sensor kinase [Thiohalophilus thiocyanatoxydans]
MHLRHKFFIVLSLLTSIPLLILLFGVVERMEREVTIRTETQLHGSLDKMASELQLILDNQKSIASGLGRVPSVRQFAAVAQSPQRYSEGVYQQRAEALEQFLLNYQKSVSSIQAVRFISAEGKTLVKIKEGKPVEPVYTDEQSGRMFIADQANRPFFREAKTAGNRVIMSDFELGQVARDEDFCPAMVRYSVPILDELGDFEGVLVVNMWGSRLDSTMTSSLGGFPGKSYIVELSPDERRDGIYLYHPNDDKRFADQLGSEHRLTSELDPADWRAIKEGDTNGSLLRNRERMLFYQKLAPYPDRPTQWLLVIEADPQVVYAPINNMRKSIWMLLGALLFISLLVAVWASGRLTAPVHQLAEIIRRFADGQRDARVQVKSGRSDEIGQAGKAFNYLAESLDRTEKERETAVRAACQSERLASLGQLAAGIGHEINNPLMNMMSLASLVEESLPEKDAEKRNDLQLLQKEGERCARIVQGILNFARQSEPKFEEFDMAALLNETLELLRHRIESEEIELQSLIETPLTMEGDARQLQQVLVNIILNAIQATPPKCRLHISGRSSEEYIDVEIVDEGEGIQAGNFSKIFDPFFSTKPEGEGTGLGLSVSYGIIKRHGGSITLENSRHAGVRVHIRLPRRSELQELDTFEILEARNVG